jgi:heme o synthase
MSLQQTFQKYYQLTKPGIVYSNVMTAAAGYLLASRWHIHWRTLIALLIGTGLIIASACVFNNYIDRSIDKRMKRTLDRALVSGAITVRSALSYAIVLGVIGFGLLSLSTWLTVILGFVAFVSYVVFYGFAKRRTVHGTLVGTIPGAAALVAGYATVSGQLSFALLFLFFVMVSWQMAHFYAIATYRLKDYTAARLPVWPVIKGVASTKRAIRLYVLAFIISLILLRVFNDVGNSFTVVMVVIGFVWLYIVQAGMHNRDEARWARGVFFCSLLVLLSLSVMLSVGKVLP